MNTLEAHKLIQTMNWSTQGVDQFTKQVKALKDAGWKIGIQAFKITTDAGQRGRKLRRPRTTWRNIAHFYNGETKERIFYWNSAAKNKATAERLASETPPPGGGENFVDFIAAAMGVTGFDKTKPIEPPCPECDKLRRIASMSQAIGQFLDWLQSERKVYLATFHTHDDGCYPDDPEHEDKPKCGYKEDDYMPFYNSIENLLAQYFNIDLSKVEAEKRALLEHIRKQA